MKVDWKDQIQRYLPRSGLLEPGNKPDKSMWELQINDSVSITTIKPHRAAGYTKRYYSS